MPVEIENIDFIAAFARNIDRVGRDSDEHAINFADKVKEIVLARIDQGEYLSGKWQEKPYSTNPIKAYKLGWATVTGQGMDKTLVIEGQLGSRTIQPDDWYWGDWDREKKGINPTWTDGERFGDSTHKPVPIFVPGYQAWRMDYNNLSDTVDLNFTGNMLDSFNLEIMRTRGSNQYGGKYTFDFVSPENHGDITDSYRKWKGITEEELNQALEFIGNDIINILWSSPSASAVRSRRFS